MDTLVFIDTNILLDFYRVRDAGLGLLSHVGSHHDRIITGSQVEMEFKKNRQVEVLRVLGNFRNPDWNTLTTPAFLASSKPQKAIVKRRKEIEGYTKNLRTKIEGVLRNPSVHDPVFQAAQKLFRHKGPLNLDRTTKARFGIRRLAWKRFILGYPPRKSGDTSTGDAINWEWIIACAEAQAKHVIIVSRDSDYGVRFGKDLILNDWLSEEFRSRVSRRRKIRLTDSLADAFKEASVPVTKKEAEDERTLLDEMQRPSQAALALEQFKAMRLTSEWPDLTKTFYKQLLEGYEQGRRAVREDPASK